MNNIVIVGRLTADPEVRYVPSSGTAVATFTVAVNRDFSNREGKREADFLDVQVWGKQGETCAEYLKKGHLVSVNGSVRVDSYIDSQGISRRAWRINANRVQFLTPKGNNNSNSQQSNTSVFEPNFDPSYEGQLVPNGFSAIDDDDMPF